MKQLFAIVLLCGILVSCSDDEMATMEYMGGTYKGEVANGEPNGQGTLTASDGSTFVGEFKDGLPNGQGIFTFVNGGKYVGEDENDNFLGQGTYTFGVGEHSGDSYVGEWKDVREWEGPAFDKNGKLTATYLVGVRTGK